MLYFILYLSFPPCSYFFAYSDFLLPDENMQVETVTHTMPTKKGWYRGRGRREEGRGRGRRDREARG